MKRFRGHLVFMCALLVFSALIIWMLRADSGAQRRPDTTIAVVLYGENADRWRSLDQGIRQACAELGLEKPALTMAGSGGVEEQITYLQRAVANGAGGLLVAAEDPALADYLEELGIPVVTVESGAGDSVPCVSADDVSMARALANLHAGKGKTVAVLAENLHRQNIKARFDAFSAQAEELGQEVWVLDRADTGRLLKPFIEDAAAAQRPDVLVILDNDTLETAAEVLGDTDVEVCGIGSSDAVVHALDQNVLDELCFSNEYAIGYIGTLTLAAEMGLAKAPQPVEMQYGIARRETMYRPENERILFPIVQ